MAKSKKDNLNQEYEIFSISQARENFSNITGKVEYAKPYSPKKRNKIVGYIVPTEDLQLLEKFEDFLDGQEALSRKNEPTYDYDKVIKEMGVRLNKIIL